MTDLMKRRADAFERAFRTCVWNDGKRRGLSDDNAIAAVTFAVDLVEDQLRAATLGDDKC